MTKIFVACFALLCAASAGATKVRPVELQELVDESELIVHGQIQLSQLIAGNCGVRYVVRIEESYKGAFKPCASLLFSSGKPLTTGDKYVLFLSKDAAAFEPILSTSSFGPRPDPERARECKRNRPLYTVNVWGNGALKVTRTYESSTRVALFDRFMIVMPKSAKTMSVNPGMRYDDIDRDDGGIDFASFRRLLSPKPAPKKP